MSYSITPHSLGGIADVAAAAQSVAEDPCLTQVATIVRRLHDLEQPAPRVAAKPGAPKPPPAPPVKGIGLCEAVRPLKMVLYVKERPWVLPIAGIALVTGLLGLGYVLGATKGRR